MRTDRAYEEKMTALGIRLLERGQGDYPEELEALHRPPERLHLVGDPALLTRPRVAIIGSRMATQTGERTARTIARTLSEEGVTIVSGLARGIDGAAHTGALEGCGSTIGIVGHGFATVYPPEHRSLYTRVKERGLLISAYPVDTPIGRYSFVERNRLIAALAEAVVVIEAAKRSGTRHTVDFALSLGKEIFVVPQHPARPNSAGLIELLRLGATPLESPSDILRILRRSSGVT
jgi:DNA processing protein